MSQPSHEDERGSPASQRGFTAVELLVTVALVGILASVALPSLGAWYDETRVASHAGRFASAVAIARSAALKFGSSVVLCASADGAGCGGAWGAGWIVFRDDDEDGDLGAGESLLVSERGGGGAPTLVVIDADDTTLARLAFDHRGYPERIADVTFSRGQSLSEKTVTAIGQVVAR